MYYYSTKIENLAVIKDMQCPICRETSNMKIGREADFLSLLFVFNIWGYGKFLATCGYCHQNFEINKNDAYKILDSVGVSINHSNMKKNLLSLSIPIIIIYIIIKIL